MTDLTDNKEESRTANSTFAIAGYRVPQTVLNLKKVQFSASIPVEIGMLKRPPIANLQTVGCNPKTTPQTLRPLNQ
jgi:hypothetical protein